MDKSKLIITITSIICITLLEGLALYKNLDGQVFSLVIAALAGLGGYSFRQSIERSINKINK